MGERGKRIVYELDVEAVERWVNGCKPAKCPLCHNGGPRKVAPRLVVLSRAADGHEWLDDELGLQAVQLVCPFCRHVHLVLAKPEWVSRRPEEPLPEPFPPATPDGLREVP